MNDYMNLHAMHGNGKREKRQRYCHPFECATLIDIRKFTFSYLFCWKKRELLDENRAPHRLRLIIEVLV